VSKFILTCGGMDYFVGFF